jgi:hypothetical protein
MALTEALKARGVYDGRAEEISKLSDSDDNTLIAIENVATFADGSKLADKIHYWPIDVIVAARLRSFTSPASRLSRPSTKSPALQTFSGARRTLMRRWALRS